MNQTQEFILRNDKGTVLGNFTAAELRVKSKDLSPSWELSKDGVKWHKLSTVKGLFPEEVIDLSPPGESAPKPLVSEPVKAMRSYGILGLLFSAPSPTPLRPAPTYTIAVLLAFALGPLGLAYSSWRATLLLLLTTILLAIPATLVDIATGTGLGFLGMLGWGLICYLGSIIWAGHAVGNVRFGTNNSLCIGSVPFADHPRRESHRSQHMPEIASQQFAMLRMFFAVARRCDNTRSEGSWASGPRSDTRPRWRPRVRFGG